MTDIAVCADSEWAATRHHCLMAKPWTEHLGESEPCDWCGRPGSVRAHAFWGEDGKLGYRNPSLCNVCFVFFDISGDVGDAFYEAGVDVYADVEEPMNIVLCEKWREKVADGRRMPPGPEESPM